MNDAFPKGFLWGGAAANTALDWQRLLSGTPAIPAGVAAGKVAAPLEQLTADTLPANWPAVLELIRTIGYKTLRVTLDWAVLCREGRQPEAQLLETYRQIFMQCQRDGIEPIVVLTTGTLPPTLATAKVDWTDRQVITQFAGYCQTMLLTFKEWVHYWIAFDDVNATFVQPRGPKLTRQAQFQALHHQLVASAEVVQLAHRVNPDNWVGCQLRGRFNYPESGQPADVLTSQKTLAINNWVCGDVQVRGSYPYFTKRYLEIQHVHLHTERNDLATLRAGKVDFLAVNYVPAGDAESDPDGLRLYLNTVYGRYGVPVLLTTTGRSDLTDDQRITQLKANIEAMHVAIEDGVDLIGYVPREYLNLSHPQAGTSQAHWLPTKSVYWYRKVIASNGADLGLDNLAIKWGLK
ncbi:family 1 glycosylhydrolase [Lactiplantibacillus modestisalitolerans]|uniref:Family 1 glycosylhydrolase n=1 Tax=Lactiplantibacillus modestisalitolerans TaxID=1457219 RepID=A0ABV5WTY6_9LACO|nr:family 1 glycosylhydrolase [Lactiplantibacillus modestisalitolerans]